MSNLIPEPRPDKNGKIVTRHVKMDVGGHPLMVPLPAPVVPHTDTVNKMEALRHDVASAIQEATMNYDDWSPDSDDMWTGEEGIRHDGIFGTLLTYSDALVEELDGIRSGSNEDRFLALARMVEQGEQERFVSNYIAFADIGGKDNSDRQTALVRSLEHYDQLKHYTNGLRDAGPEVQDGASGLLTVVMLIDDIYVSEDAPDDVLRHVPHGFDFEAAPVLANPELVDLILENPHHVPAVIAERKVFDPETIRVVLEHPERALSDGAL